MGPPWLCRQFVYQAWPVDFLGRRLVGQVGFAQKAPSAQKREILHTKSQKFSIGKDDRF
jgi:hypothetical protein